MPFYFFDFEFVSVLNSIKKFEDVQIKNNVYRKALGIRPVSFVLKMPLYQKRICRL